MTIRSIVSFCVGLILACLTVRAQFGPHDIGLAGLGLAAATRSARVNAKKSAAAANLWPGMTLATSIQFTRIGRGLPISRPNQFMQQHARFYSIQDVPTAANLTSLTYFTDALAVHKTNINNGQLPDEKPVWITGICVTPEPYKQDGTQSAGLKFDAAAITTWARAEAWDKILSAGLLRWFINDRMIFECKDLTHFPSDGGTFVPAAALSFAAATNGSCAPLTNGQPIAGNRFRFPAPIPLLPNKPFRVEISWPATFTQQIVGACALKVELVGETVLPLNA